MFQPQRGVGGNGNKVDQYLSIGVVQSSGFIDILSWWSARKELLSGHYQMAMDYHGTSATSTPSERVKALSRRLYRNHGLRKAQFTHRCLLDFLSFQGGELHALLGDAELRG
ncbi:unnamed protein product [Sphagnum jensenii]|uniref:HAT C-terminal dimerisation domain-containing protein n=1 Tax=Sphagnum jensenii TaxID=128206 RepID=A0ABP0VSK3_9BRYO